MLPCGHQIGESIKSCLLQDLIGELKVLRVLERDAEELREGAWPLSDLDQASLPLGINRKRALNVGYRCLNQRPFQLQIMGAFECPAKGKNSCRVRRLRKVLLERVGLLSVGARHFLGIGLMGW